MNSKDFSLSLRRKYERKTPSTFYTRLSVSPSTSTEAVSDTHKWNSYHTIPPCILIQMVLEPLSPSDMVIVEKVILLKETVVVASLSLKWLVRNMGLSRLDKVILVLPILGVFDVLSTLYAGYLGYSLERYEAGLLASFFAMHGLLYLHIPVYLGILVGMTWVLLRIKSKLKSSALLDKAVFLLLVGAVCFMYARLLGTILMNVLLFSGRKVSGGMVEGLVYLFSMGYVVILVWRDIVEWMKEKEINLDETPARADSDTSLKECSNTEQ